MNVSKHIEMETWQLDCVLASWYCVGTPSKA